MMLGLPVARSRGRMLQQEHSVLGVRNRWSLNETRLLPGRKRSNFIISGEDYVDQA
jgi:hypothetical protein